MRIVLLCTAQANQVALANKIAAEFDLVGIVTEKRKVNKAKKYTLKNILTKLSHKILFRKIIQAWWNMLDHYQQLYSKFPDTKIVEVSNINDEAVAHFIKEMKADLVMVSGTSMVRKNILSVPLSIGMINLHTGLSPYIKGGPNCTNWCIATNQFHLIGNSIMWIDAGIDSGDLLTTAIVGFTGKESLLEIHIKVMEEAHALYVLAIRSIADNKAPRINQDSIAKGITYYSKEWNYKANKDLLKNLKQFNETVNSGSYHQKIKETITVNIV
jgi:methionyl-tRNA formyltransferase